MRLTELLEILGLLHKEYGDVYVKAFGRQCDSPTSARIWVERLDGLAPRVLVTG